MNYIYLLGSTLLAMTIIQIGITAIYLCRIFQLRFAAVPLESINSRFAKIHPKANNTRVLLSIMITSSPILLFYVYMGLEIENKWVETTVILLLIFLTAYLIYFNYFKIWSEKFKAPANPKIASEKSLKENKKNNKNFIDKLAQVEIKTLDKIDEFKSEISEEILIKTKKKDLEILKKNLPLKSYFINEQVYKEFEILLQENGFYKKKQNHKAVPLCILTCKLDDLKLIKLNRKQKHFCDALALHFKIDPFNDSNLSTIRKDFKNDSWAEDKKDVFRKFEYLNKLNKS